jgi:peroxiredoxin
MKVVARVAATALTLVLLAVLVSGCSRPVPKPTALQPPHAEDTSGQMQQAEINQPAPDFTLTTLDGKTIRLSDLKGKPVIINFWASWCHYCVQEAPDLEAVYKQYHPRGLQLLGVGTDEAAKLQAKAKELGLTYPIGSNPKAAEMYGVQGIPHSFFVGKDGKLISQVVGAVPRPELETQVKKIL